MRWLSCVLGVVLLGVSSTAHYFDFLTVLAFVVGVLLILPIFLFREEWSMGILRDIYRASHGRIECACIGFIFAVAVCILRSSAH